MKSYDEWFFLYKLTNILYYNGMNEEEKKNEITGSDFFDRITETLKSIGVSRSTFISDLKLTQAMVTNWKQLRGLPATETVLKVAKYLHVSPYWLAYGQLEPDSPYDEMEPSKIAERFYQFLSSWHNERYYRVPELRRLMINCAHNRYRPSMGEIILISESFNIPINYLLNNRGFEQFEIKDKVKWSRVENIFNSLPIEHQNALDVQFKSFTNLKELIEKNRILQKKNDSLMDRLKNKSGRIDLSKTIKAHNNSEDDDMKRFDPIAFLENHEPPEDSE